MRNLTFVLALIAGLALSSGIVAMAFQGLRTADDANVNGIFDAGVHSVRPEMLSREEIRDRFMGSASSLFEGEKAPVLDKILDALDLYRAGPDSFEGVFSGLSGGPDAVTCEVRNSSGTAITSFKAFNYGALSNWLYYGSGGTVAAEVNFLVVPLFTGSPLALIWQIYQPNSSTGIITPFGIPFWGGNLTAGAWALVVLNNLGEFAVYTFNVTP